MIQVSFFPGNVLALIVRPVAPASFRSQCIITPSTTKEPGALQHCALQARQVSKVSTFRYPMKRPFTQTSSRQGTILTGTDVKAVSPDSDT